MTRYIRGAFTARTRELAAPEARRRGLELNTNHSKYRTQYGVQRTRTVNTIPSSFTSTELCRCTHDAEGRVARFAYGMLQSF